MVDRIKQIAYRTDAWLIAHRTTRVIRRATIGFLHHNALNNAGSMAYFAILSIFQLIVLGVVILSYFLGEGAARNFIIEQVVNATPLEADTVAEIIDGVIASRGGVGIVSVIFLLWGALGLFSALNRGIASAFVTAKPRDFLRDKLVGLAIVGLVGVLALLALGIGFLTNILRHSASDAIAAVPGGDAALTLFGLLVPLLLIFIAFLAIYRITPNRPVSLAEVWPAALLATILFSILRIGFTFFATEVANYDTVFGPISTAIILLVFLYFASVVVLLGAELARANVLDDELTARPLSGDAVIEASISEAAHATSLDPQRGAERPLPGWSMAVGGIVARRVVRRIARRGTRLR